MDAWVLTIRLPFAGVLDYFQGRTVSHECFPETLTHPRKFWWIDTKKWWALENRISLSNMAILGIYVQFQGGTVSLADKIHFDHILKKHVFFWGVVFQAWWIYPPQMHIKPTLLVLIIPAISAWSFLKLQAVARNNSNITAKIAAFT